MRRGLDAFGEDAEAWRAAVGVRSPVYDRLLAAAAAIFDQPAGSLEEAARARVEAAWRERRLSAGYDRPLLLMAALRAEALRAGPRHPLFEAIGATDVRPEAATREALATTLADAPPRLYADLATRRVQTNETSRAVAWLWPAALAGCADGKRPLALFDVGCSAGLNLCAERLPAPWRDPAGAPIPVAAAANIVARHGFDVQPLDVGRGEDINWLRACIWPGENARLERLAAAVDAFRAAATGPTPPRLEIADLVEVPARLERLARAAAPETVLLAYQTVVRDYLADEPKAQYIEGMTDWVEAEAAGGPRRIWIELEAAPDAWKDPGGLPMALDAHIADPADRAGGMATLTLAHCSYHPDLLAPEADALAVFVAGGYGNPSRVPISIDRKI
ncbi:MAG TPA: DUF2332 family protein [Polyangia bacterium]|nr:DUF2332 family protein [Polyangia bacterium]